MNENAKYKYVCMKIMYVCMKDWGHRAMGRGLPSNVDSDGPIGYMLVKKGEECNVPTPPISGPHVLSRAHGPTPVRLLLCHV